MTQNLSPLGQFLLDSFLEQLPVLQQLREKVNAQLAQVLTEQGIELNAMENRVKTAESLAGKLERKGDKYHRLTDITDLVGFRIITFYTNDVDKVAAIVKHEFRIDWDNSVDKRKMHQLNSFGYNSLHYICRLPKTIIDDPAAPELNTIRFELQMRTALQHVWSSIEHDIGYKGVVHLPSEYKRQFSRLAGMLELIDDEFSRLRTKMAEYSRQVQILVASGQLDEVPLNFKTFYSYLELRPFDRLNGRIAAVNQAEIFPTSLVPFLPVLEDMGFETLGDIERFIAEDSDDAYQLAVAGLAVTDLDIIAENIGLQSLCFIHVLKNGGGLPALIRILDILNGKRESNQAIAQNIIKQASLLACFTKGSQ